MIPSQSITPSRSFYVVTPDDDTDLPMQPKGLWIAEDGNLTVKNAAGQTVGPYAVVAGQIVPISPARVLETTTATVVALA